MRSAARTGGSSFATGRRASVSMPWSSARDALHGAVGDLLGERAVAGVESLGGGRERSIGVGVLLEDAQDDLVRGPPCGRDRHQRRPRSQEA